MHCFYVGSKRFSLIVWLIAIFALICFFNLRSANAEFRIGWKNQADIANFIQLDKKHQKVARETIAWKKYDDDFKALHNLSIGQVDAVPVDMVTFLSVITVGLQGRVIAIDRQYGKESALIVKSQKHIDTPQDLVGKNIAVPFMTSSYYSLLRYLQHNDIPVEKIHLVNMNYNEITQAWQKNEIDGAYADGTTVLPFVKDGHVLVDSSQLAKWGYPTYQVWVVMDEIISDQPFWMESFVKKILKNIDDNRRNIAYFTPQSSKVGQLAQLLNKSPEVVCSLLKQQTYLDKTQQSLILSRYLSKEFDEIGLFMKAQKIMPDILPDYLIYVYDSFIKNNKNN